MTPMRAHLMRASSDSKGAVEQMTQTNFLLTATPHSDETQTIWITHKLSPANALRPDEASWKCNPSGQMRESTVCRKQ